jgi:hypothetical protein
MRRLLLLPLAALVALSVACGGDDAETDAGDPPSDEGGWQRLSDSPLSPRTDAATVWTGEEVLVLGGHSREVCSRGGDCFTADPPDLADGAAYDREAGTWRPIADAPRPLGFTSRAVADDAVYFFDGNVEPASLLRYDLATDSWSSVETPFQDPAWWSIAEVPSGLVAYIGSEEAIERPMFLLDAATGKWSEVPPDPLSPGFDRWVTATGDGFVLTDHEMPAAGDFVTRAAAYKVADGAWERLADGDVGTSLGFVALSGLVVNPALPMTDMAGDVHAMGGILDPAADAWRPLPAAPSDTSPGMGVVSSDDAYYGLADGYVLDVEAARWVEVPSLQGERRPDGSTTTDRRAVTAAGRDLFVFGGTRWSDDGMDGEVLGDAWLWTPPA